MSEPYDPSGEGAQTDFDNRMSYGDYLQLDAILTAQHPKSDAHDEMLFIIQHQTAELWMRLIIHEVDQARRSIADDQVQPAFKMLSRVARIFEQLNSAWDVLRTMTPSEYTEFRDALGQSSGFQSFQYRMIEFMVGNRNPAMLKPHAHRPDLVEQLQAELLKPSLYDEALRLLHRTGIEIPDELRKRIGNSPAQAHPALIAAWQKVYTDTATWWPLYELGEKLIDFEDYFRRWRFNHLTTVERVIGLKRGTGGTEGIAYLRRMLETVLFPDLWQVRTAL